MKLSDYTEQEPEDPCYLLMQHQAAQQIQDLIDTLRPREALVIRLRFFEELTLKDVGKKIASYKEGGVIAERARQIEGVALRKLKRYCRIKSITISL